MEFSYTINQRIVKKMLKEFYENEIAPIAREIDVEAKHPAETIAHIGRLLKGCTGIKK